MITRATDADAFAAVVEKCSEFATHPYEWFNDPHNIVLTDGEGNFALFEVAPTLPHVANGHYFFTARGKKALTVAREMLDEIFSDYGIEILTGIIALKGLGARWLTRQLGFKSQGIVYDGQPCEFFILTKKDAHG